MILDALGCCVRDHVWSDCESNHLMATNKDFSLSSDQNATVSTLSFCSFLKLLSIGI